MLYSLIGNIVFLALFFIAVIAYIERYRGEQDCALWKRKNTAADQRTSLTQEVINHIKTVKLYGWVNHMEERLEESRKKEMDALKDLFLHYAFNDGFWALFNGMLPNIIFFSYLYFGNTISLSQLIVF